MGLGARHWSHNSRSPFAILRKEAEEATGRRRTVLSEQRMSLPNESLVLSQSEHCVDGVETRSNIVLDDICWSTPAHEENNMKNLPCHAAGCSIVRVHSTSKSGPAESKSCSIAAIAASSVAAWKGPRDRLTASIHKAVISSSLTLFDFNQFLPKQNGTAKRVRLLVRKIRMRVRVGNMKWLAKFTSPCSFCRIQIF